MLQRALNWPETLEPTVATLQGKYKEEERIKDFCFPAEFNFK